MNRPTLKKLKEEALSVSNHIGINWEMLATDPTYLSDFESIMHQSSAILPQLEDFYVKLINNTHLLVDSGEHISKEMFLDTLEDELFATYQIVDMWDRYRMIVSITSDATLA